jgi:hypothetical protein
MASQQERWLQMDVRREKWSIMLEREVGTRVVQAIL